MSDISIYTISCIGFDEQERESISAILGLGYMALNCSWKIVDGTECEVRIINVESEAGKALLAEKDSFPSYSAIWVATQPHSDVEFFLEKEKKSPPSLRELTQLLNKIELLLNESPKEVIERVKVIEPDVIVEPAVEVELEESVDTVKEVKLKEKAEPIAQKNSVSKEEIKSVEARPVNQKSIKKNNTNGKKEKKTEPKKIIQSKPKDKEKIEPTVNLNYLEDSGQQVETRQLIEKNYLFGVLLGTKNDEECKIISSDTLPSLYLDPKKDSYYFSGTEEALVQLCVIDPQQLNYTGVTEAKFEAVLKGEEDLITFEGFDALIGYAIFNASQGRLLTGLSAERMVKLVQTPDSVKIPVLKRYEEISTLLYDQEMSVLGVVEKLQINLPYVFDYFNICYLLGYLREIEEVEYEEDELSIKPRSMFTTFFKK